MVKTHVSTQMGWWRVGGREGRGGEAVMHAAASTPRLLVDSGMVVGEGGALCLSSSPCIHFTTVRSCVRIWRASLHLARRHTTGGVETTDRPTNVGLHLTAVSFFPLLISFAFDRVKAQKIRAVNV